MIRRPLNKQSILFDYSGVRRGLFGRGEYVPMIIIQGVCKNDNCRNSSEHITFDGQIFYRRKHESK